ncbi:hypothetical protein Ahy_B08g093275 [Arachis hypogaea]|uniref:Zinc finger GRF-type domain-containing protein n=1 Tax=Arachis hypogaea TaxID=3818 RepID=A0A444Y5Q2_ARAHY|nr:hypothetical protein Ahy_B08g093275 [Arachis hypogaea]
MLRCNVQAVTWLWIIKRGLLFMQQSGTTKNPDKIFLDCSYYGMEQRHCNFFIWLDELIANGCGNEDDNDIQGRMMMMDKRLEQLEFKIEDEYEAK